MHKWSKDTLTRTLVAVGFQAAVFALLAFGSGLGAAEAQAAPTASRNVELSVFGGLSGNYTGLAGGRNLDIVAGADIGFRSFFALYPSLEVRGQYPIDGGAVDQQKNVLGGLKIARFYGRVHPYGDVLFGRGAIDYRKFRFPTSNPDFYYRRSVSDVWSFGGGVDLGLTDRLQLKLDAQVQRYSTPVTESGRLYSKPLSVGLVYRFHFGN